MKLNALYFSPVEFAKIFGIDKQTLIYYDNQKIFSPKFKNRNGYRYYSLEQVPYFSVLLALRNLDIHGNLLKVYTEEPTQDILIELLSDRIQEYNGTIEALQKRVTALRSIINEVQAGTIPALNKIMLIPQPTFYYQRSALYPHTSSYKKSLLESSLLIQKYAQNLLTSHLQPSIAPLFNTLDDLQGRWSYRFLLLTHDKSVLENPLIIPPALYLTLYMPGKLKHCLPLAKTKIKTFAEQVDLTCNSLLLITPIRNFNFQNHSDSFITKFELQVDYQQ